MVSRKGWAKERLVNRNGDWRLYFRASPEVILDAPPSEFQHQHNVPGVSPCQEP